jgi:hypothetical protein
MFETEKWKRVRIAKVKFTKTGHDAKKAWCAKVNWNDTTISSQRGSKRDRLEIYM